jgi:hypothetical protein
MATVVCEKHRLRYDAETQSGCVTCRREAAATAGGVLPGSAPAAGRQPEVASSIPKVGLTIPLAVAASIWFVSAFVLYAAHRKIAANFLSDPAVEAAELGLETEPTPGTAAGQTDAVLEELRILQGDEPAPYGTGAPPAIPSSEQLAPESPRIDESEEPNTEPVEFETGEPGGG